MRQLQEAMTEVQAQARRSAAVTADKVQESESTPVDLLRETEATLKRVLDARTEVVLDTATGDFDDIFDDVNAAVEGLDWKV